MHGYQNSNNLVSVALMLQNQRKAGWCGNPHASQEWKRTREPMYRGQGKDRGLSNNEYNTIDFLCDHAGDHCTALGAQSETTPDDHQAPSFDGLNQPCLDTLDNVVFGHNKMQMKKENKQHQTSLKAYQPVTLPWTTHQELLMHMLLPTGHANCPPHCNSLCLTRRVLQHLAATLLSDWAQFGCPTKTGKPWTKEEIKEEIWEAVAWGPPPSSLLPESIVHFADKVAKKTRTNQARLVDWHKIKDAPPKELKNSPIAAISHKLKANHSILDLSFCMCLIIEGMLAAVNDTTKKTAPAGAIAQIGKCLSRIIHVFAGAIEDVKIFMAKWDIQDGFSRKDCADGED